MKLVNITGRVLNPDLTPVPYAIGKAVLTSCEVDGGVIVPSVVDIVADANGDFVVSLWPNGRGSGGSQYIVKLYNGFVTVFDARIFVPDVDVSVDLSTIVISPPYPPVNQSLRALLEIQESQVLIDAAKRDVFSALGSSEQSQSAALQSKTEAQTAAGLAVNAQADIHNNWQGKLDTAAQQAETATTQAGIATDKAAEASGSAVAANEAKTAAELARDAAMVGAVTYPDEATGRAAVADGEYFKVAGSGNVAVSEHRRINASTSVLVTQFPSTAYVVVKDSLRESVEATSGGRMTVLYTAAGNPSFMHVLPAFMLEDIAPGGELGTGRHPAFIVNGVPKSEIFIGAYQASMIGSEAVSLPMKAPRTSITFDNAKASCVAAGSGFHLMTNWEWAAVALWCAANGFEPRGNTNYGRHHVNRIETGRKISSVSNPGNISSGLTLTGSGPATWSHDGTPAGIHDLVGNVLEWQDGLRLQDGRVIMPIDNNYLALEEDWVAHDLLFSSSSTNKTGTLSLVTSEDEVFRNGEIGSDVNSGFNDSQVWSNLGITGDAPLITKQALIAPSILLPAGRAYARTYGARFPFRGGGWDDFSGAGLSELNFRNSRAYASKNIGFRPAFAI